MFTRLSTSRPSTMRFVRQRIWEFSPLMPLTVTCTRFASQGASTYTSSMCGSARSTSKMPAPTEWRYAMAHMSSTTSSRPEGPHTLSTSSHLSVSEDLAMPMTESLSRGPPLERCDSLMSPITSMTIELRPSG